MQLKRILKAALNIRNIVLLAGVIIVTYLTGYLPFALVGAAGYLFFVLQSLRSKTPDESDPAEAKMVNLTELDAQCSELYRETRNEIDRPLQKRVEDILQDKDEIMELFRSDQDDYVKQRVTEQVLKLSTAYIDLISDYCKRRGNIASTNTGEMIDGINTNIRKLNTLKDAQAIEDMKHAIEMDKKVLEKVDQEKRDLEKISARLTYIESTLKTFKHRMQTCENTEGTSAEIENIINEADALDHALNDSKRERLKL